MAELIAPITEDLRKENSRFDVIKGLEQLKLKDEKLYSGVTTTVIPGEWMVLDNDGTLHNPGSSAVANTYPVVSGNDQYDAQATGQLTIAIGGGFIYRSDLQGYVAGSYSAGQNLTIKGSDRKLQAAGGSDPVLARVYKAPDAKGVMEIQVLDR